MAIRSLRELHQNPDFRGLPPVEQMRAFEMVAAQDADYQALPPEEQTRARRMVLSGLPSAVKQRQQLAQKDINPIPGMEPLAAAEPGYAERLAAGPQATPGSLTEMNQQITGGIARGARAAVREPGVLARTIPRMVMEAASGRDPFTSSPEGMEFSEQGGELGAGALSLARGATAPFEAVGREGGVETVAALKAAGVELSEEQELRIIETGGMAGALGGVGAMGAAGPVARALGVDMPRPQPPGQAWVEAGKTVPRNFTPERVFHQPGQVEGLVPYKPPVVDEVAAAGQPGFQPPAVAPRTMPPRGDPAQEALGRTVRQQGTVAPVEGGARAVPVPKQPKSPEQLAEEAYTKGRQDQIAAHQVELDARIRQLERGVRAAPEEPTRVSRPEPPVAAPVAGRGEYPPPEPVLPSGPAAPPRAPVQPPASAQAQADQLLEGFGEVPPELQAEIDRLGPAPAGKEYVYRFEGPTQTKGGEWFTTDPGEAASYAKTPEARGAGRIRISAIDSAALDDINRQLGREPSMRGEFRLPQAKPGFVEELGAARDAANAKLKSLVGDPAELPPSLGARAQEAIDELTRMRDAGEIELNAGVPLKGKQLKAAAEVASVILWRLAKDGLKEGARLYVPFTRRLAAEFPELKAHAKQLYDEGKKQFFSLEAQTPGGIITRAEYDELYEIGRMMGGDKWYTRNMDALRKEAERVYGTERAQQLVRMAAAISQRTTTGVTAAESIRTVDALVAGKTTRELPPLSGIAKKMKEAKRSELLNEGTVTGPKLADFDVNLQAGYEGKPPPESVADSLKFKIMGFPAGEGVKAPTTAARRFTKSVDEQLAKEKGVAPGEVQAATWVSARHHGLGKIPLDKANSELSFGEELFDHLERAGKMPEGKFNYADIARRHAKFNGSTTHPKLGDLAGSEAYSVSIFPDETLVQYKPFTAAQILQYRIAKNGLLRSDPQISIGTWFDQETGKHHLDLVVTPKSREEAIHLAEQYGQKAIFDLKNMKEINTFTEREIPASELPPASERMAQFREAEKTAQRIRLRHFSPEPLDEITTEHFGEGALSNAEKRRGATPAIHGYLGDVPPEPEVLANAEWINEFELPRGKGLYDIGKDPEGLVAKAGSDVTSVEEILRDRGLGMVNTAMPDEIYRSIVKWFGSRPVVWRQKIDSALREQIQQQLAARAKRPPGTVVGSLGGGAQDFVEDLPHMAAIGALKIARGATDLASFTAEMVKEFPQHKDRIEELFAASRRVFVNTVTLGERAAKGDTSELKGPITHEPLSRSAVKAAGELFTNGSVKRDPEKLISDQVMELISSEQVPMPAIDRILKRHGLTFAEFGEQMFRPAITDAARRMQALAALQRKINVLEGGKPSSERARELGELRRLRTQFEQEAWKDPFLSLLRRLDRVRRGLMVTQLATSMRNVISQAGRVGINAMDVALEAALQRGIEGVTGKAAANPVRALDGLEIIGRLFQKNKGLADEVLENYPLLNHRMFNNYASDVAAAAKTQSYKLAGVDATLNGLDTAVDVLNTVNRAQEFLFRRAAFVATVAQKARLKGFDLYKASKDELAQLSRADVEEGVEKALELTFASNPKTDFGRAFLKVFSTPGVTLITPFPRFMQNALKFYFDFSPLGFAKLLSPTELKSIAAGNTKTLSRAIIGTGMLGAALALRRSEHAGERWYELKIGGKTYDMRPFNPFAAYLLVAHLYDRTRGEGAGATIGVSREERQELSRAVIQNFFGANLKAGAGREILDAITTGFTDVGAMKWTKQLAGETLAGMLAPLQTVFDVMAEYDEELAKRRDTKTDPVKGPIKAKIPWKAKELPEFESSTREATPKRMSPLLRQLTGMTEVEPKNEVEKELDRLQFSYRQITAPTGDAEADRLLRKHMGPLTEKFNEALGQPFYRELSDPRKKFLLKMILAAVRSAAREAASAEDPERFLGLRLETLPEELIQMMKQEEPEAAEQIETLRQ